MQLTFDKNVFLAVISKIRASLIIAFLRITSK